MVRGALFVDLDGVLVPEGGVPREELVDEDSQRPPVHRGGVALVMDDFGREVLRGTAQGVRLDRVARLVVSQALGEAKVDELDVALAVEEQVLGLHVPVGYPPLLLVQVLQDQDNLGGVEAGHVLAEPAELAQVGEELATGHVVEEDVEELVVREGGDEAGDEGVSGHVCQDLALVAHVVELLELDHCDGSALVLLLPKPGASLPSVLRRIFSAYTLLRSASVPWDGRTRQTRAKVPGEKVSCWVTESRRAAQRYLFLMSAP